FQQLDRQPKFVECVDYVLHILKRLNAWNVRNAYFESDLQYPTAERGRDEKIRSKLSKLTRRVGGFDSSNSPFDDLPLRPLADSAKHVERIGRRPRQQLDCTISLGTQSICIVAQGIGGTGKHGWHHRPLR